MSDRIDSYKPYSQQIELTCKNHKHLVWQTKNIAPIGARRIFFDLFGVTGKLECDCSMSELELLIDSEI